VIKVVRVALALILKAQEEVEEVEGKCRCGSVGRCWKPAETEELCTFGEGYITTTVADNETMNTR
jgi:hypothetical protein